MCGTMHGSVPVLVLSRAWIYRQFTDLSIITTVKSFSFIGHLILCISLVRQSTNLTSQQNVD